MKNDTNKEENKSSKPFLTPEEAQKAGLDIKLRTPDGSIVDPLAVSSNEDAWLSRMITRSVSLLTTLIDHPDPQIAIHAANSIIDRAVLLKEISQWSQPLLRPSESNSDKALSYDRVGTDGGHFDRGGIGDDKMFSARLSPEDIAALEKIEGKNI